MSKLTESLVKDLPPYISLIEQPREEVKGQPLDMLIDKINKYNTEG